MKKILSLIASIAFVALFASCITDNSETMLPAADSAVAADPLTIPLDRALDEMYATMDALYGPATRSGGRRAATVETVKRSQLGARTRTADDPAFPDEKVYLVNFGDDEGFAVLGANVYMPSLICITEKGSFTLEEYLAIAASESQAATRSGDDDGPVWMSYEDIHNYGYGEEGNPDPFVYEDYCIDWDEGDEVEEDTGDWLIYSQDHSFVKKSIVRLTQPEEGDPGGSGGNPPSTVTYTYGAWTLQTNGRIGPFLNTQWHQGSPFNKYSPIRKGDNAPAGCVAIALAQIIAFRGIQATSTFDTSGAVTSTWAELRGHDYGTFGVSLPNAARIRDDMAKIVRTIGKGVHTYYTAKNGGATFGAAKNYLKKHGYSNVEKKKDNREACMISMLRDTLPVFIKARRDGSGHMWVIDGSATQTRAVEKYINGAYHSTSTETRSLYHCNFGWEEGSANGYYLYDVFISVH